MKLFRQGILPLLLTGLLLLAGCSAQPGAESGVEATSAIQSAVQSDTEQSEHAESSNQQTPGNNDPDTASLTEDGEYTSKQDVARYLDLYGHLPGNYITKKEARALGWDAKAGNLGQVAPGKSIGGDHFGNYEGNLPQRSGRSYRECDIDSTGGYRSAKRIVYSNDGLIYYTKDHYKTFELLYGKE